MTTQPGMPCWVYLGKTYVYAATEFYTKLFGWTATVSAEPEAQGYTIFNKDGKAAAGVGPLMGDGQPVAWSMYVKTTDVDALTVKVGQAGGKVLVPPMDVMKFGRMAVYSDQSNAAFSAWQPGEMAGADIMGVPDTFWWAELITRDPAGAKDFYPKVIGWEPDDQPRSTQMGDFVYTVFRSGGAPVAGMIPMFGDMWPADLPDHWMNYFMVSDCDATVAKAKQLGGSVSVEPMEIPPGRFAVLSDPQGGFFSVIAANPDFQMT